MSPAFRNIFANGLLTKLGRCQSNLSNRDLQIASSFQEQKTGLVGPVRIASSRDAVTSRLAAAGAEADCGSLPRFLRVSQKS
jgi:hypothetical protein